ncbi:hypothetical protein E0K89_005230 [Aquicoccus sp. SCR17]|nr:hypothetical protein [Carideicomes alvinocaridis]
MLEQYKELAAELADLRRQTKELREQEQNVAVAAAYRSYLEPSQTIYNDLRKYLTKHPL